MTNSFAIIRLSDSFIVAHCRDYRTAVSVSNHLEAALGGLYGVERL